MDDGLGYSPLNPQSSNVTVNISTSSSIDQRTKYNYPANSDYFTNPTEFVNGVYQSNTSYSSSSDGVICYEQDPRSSAYSTLIRPQHANAYWCDSDPYQSGGYNHFDGTTGNYFNGAAHYGYSAATASTSTYHQHHHQNALSGGGYHYGRPGTTAQSPLLYTGRVRRTRPQGSLGKSSEGGDRGRPYGSPPLPSQASLPPPPPPPPPTQSAANSARVSQGTLTVQWRPQGELEKIMLEQTLIQV